MSMHGASRGSGDQRPSVSKLTTEFEDTVGPFIQLLILKGCYEGVISYILEGLDFVVVSRDRACKAKYCFRHTIDFIRVY